MAALSKRRLKRLERKVRERIGPDSHTKLVLIDRYKDQLDFISRMPETREEAIEWVAYQSMHQEVCIRGGVDLWPDWLKEYKPFVDTVTEAYLIDKFELYELLEGSNESE